MCAAKVVLQYCLPVSTDWSLLPAPSSSRFRFPVDARLRHLYGGVIGCTRNDQMCGAPIYFQHPDKLNVPVDYAPVTSDCRSQRHVGVGCTLCHWPQETQSAEEPGTEEGRGPAELVEGLRVHRPLSQEACAHGRGHAVAGRGIGVVMRIRLPRIGEACIKNQA